MKRKYCRDISLKNLNQKIKLNGWINNRRDHGGVIFIDLRDISGFCQIVFDPTKNKEAYKIAEGVRNEYTLEIIGIVVKRSKDTINKKIETGEIEIETTKIKVLSISKALPFQLDQTNFASEQTRLKYRYIDLRRKELQNNFIIRSKLNQYLRNFFWDKNFIEIETPILTKSTPEGARDFLVPSRLNTGNFYALPQSPQLFKQLLMVSGFEKYFQLVRCFRDEDLRGNRQPEFTQLDMELSFTDQQEIIEIIEELIVGIFKHFLGLEIKGLIQHLTYEQAITNYGLDSPDLRYELKIVDISDIVSRSQFKIFQNALKTGVVNAILVPNGEKLLSRKMLDDYIKFVKIYNLGGLAWAKISDNTWQSPIAKFISESIKQDVNKKLNANNGDIILFAADKFEVVKTALGNLRKEIANNLNLYDKKSFSFCWVTDFPLMEFNKEEKRWVSVHHPFTQPKIESIDILTIENIKNIKSYTHDFVINGEEVCGGSIRIHNKNIQNRVFELLNISKQEADSKFKFLLDAFDYGAPPHGGIAIGLDRLMMQLIGTDSIRDIIAFPKTQTGNCLMTNAPSSVDVNQLKELGIKLSTSLNK